MTRSIRGARRGAALLAGAFATALLAAGCGTGQIAETASLQATVSGINAETPNGLFKIRNVAVDYLDPLGYPAGGNAPLRGAIYNDSLEPVTVEISTDSAQGVSLVDPTATPTPGASPTDGASPGVGGSPDASPEATDDPNAGSRPDPSQSPAGTPEPGLTPGPPAGGPARFEIPAGGFVVLDRTAGSYLQLVNLDRGLRPGQSVNLVFDFNGERIETPVPVAVPLSPAPKGSADGVESGGGHD